MAKKRTRALSDVLDQLESAAHDDSITIERWWRSSATARLHRSC